MSAKEHATKPRPNRAAAPSAKRLRRKDQPERFLIGVDSTATSAIEGENDASLPDIFDHVLKSGVVLRGSVVISLAGVDLVYIGLNVVLTSVETALRNLDLTP